MVDAPKPIRLPSIPDVIYSTLRREISHGVYPPGRISIRRLAEHFGVSAMPVREALRRLEAEGLVSFNAGRQVVINSLSLAEVEEVFAIRIELEDLALRIAVPKLRNDEANLARLNELLALLDTQEKDRDAWRRSNEEFHHSIYAAAAMPRLQGIIESLWIAVEPYLRFRFDANTAESLRLAQEQHRLILEHVRAGNTRAARKLLREHLETTLDGLRSSFDQDDWPAADSHQPPDS